MTELALRARGRVRVRRRRRRPPGPMWSVAVAGMLVTAANLALAVVRLLRGEHVADAVVSLLAACVLTAVWWPIVTGRRELADLQLLLVGMALSITSIVLAAADA